jgi:hypothetical protein
VLRQVAEGVLIHESEFCQGNAVVVHGWDWVAGARARQLQLLARRSER